MNNLNDYLFDNCMSEVTSSNEALALLYLWRKAREEGGEIKEQVQVQQLHIARICFYNSDKKGNVERFVSKIKTDLIQHGYIINTTVSWIIINKKKIRTTTWILSKKSIKLLKEALKKCGYTTTKKQAKTAKKKENNINKNDMENNNNLTLFQQRQKLNEMLKNT